MIKRTLTLDALRGKRLAVDAYNYLYQFLALIRTRNGTPLHDSHGNVTSHLTGLMFRSTRLMHDFNITLVFVFDGKPPNLKAEEIRKRHQQREKARQEWHQALKARDYGTAFSKAMMTSRLTPSMLDDAKTLLQLLGIPMVQAPSEAEAQAAYMAIQRDVWAASSKDYDTLLFGAPRVLRFLTLQGKEYLPSKGVARPLQPELLILRRFLAHHQLSREQLIDLAILVGTDFNPGIKGVGPKTALKLVKEYGQIENLPSKYRESITPQFNDVRAIYLNPKITAEYDLTSRPLQEEELFRFLCDQRDFARNRVELIVKRMKAMSHLPRQAGIEKWVSRRK
jgi:flap endonuclease-1